MTKDEVAKLLVANIDRHGLRGLIYDAGSTMEEVVMHAKGRDDKVAWVATSRKFAKLSVLPNIAIDRVTPDLRSSVGKPVSP